MHDQATDRTPPLRAGMSPEQHPLSRPGIIANRPNQMGSPNPRAREQDHSVEALIVLHPAERCCRLLLGGDDQFVPDQFQPSLGQCVPSAVNQPFVDEWLAHGIFQSVFVDAIDYESDFGLDHSSSSVASRLGAPQGSQTRIKDSVLLHLSLVGVGESNFNPRRERTPPPLTYTPLHSPAVACSRSAIFANSHAMPSRIPW